MRRLLGFYAAKTIPGHIRADDGNYQRARLLVYFLLIFILMSLVSTVGMLVYQSNSSVNFQNGVYLPTVQLFVGLGALYLFRKTGSQLLAANCFTTMTYVGIVFTCVFNYLHYSSPAFQAFPLVVVFAFLMGGKVNGVAWAVIVSATIFVLGTFQVPLNSMPELQQGQALASLHLAVAVICFVCLAVCLSVYDMLNRRMMRSLNLQRDRFIELSRHDDLTGLRNRGSFEALLRRSVSLAEFTGEGLALLYLDLDGFKPVNDRNGHAVGDQLLEEVASRLKTVVRKGDSVARLGGDEFAILLHVSQQDATAVEFARKFTRHIDREISREYEIAGQKINVGVSVGVAVFNVDASAADMLLRYADTDMYRLKKERQQDSREESTARKNEDAAGWAPAA